MNKLRLLKLTNTVLFISFSVQVVTSCIIFFRIKVPHPQSVFEIHEYNDLLMIAVALLHVTLNWGWIRANLFTRAPVPPCGTVRDSTRQG